MPKGQKNIYYITGDDIDTLKNSPQLEGFTARGIEVLLLADPIDEFWPEVFKEYDGKDIRSVTNAGDDVEKVKPISELTGEAMEENLQKVLTAKIKEVLGTDINDVRLTDRLYKSPVALVAGAGQMSIHLERLMKQHGQAQAYPSERILEVNPRHPLIKKLAQHILDKKDEEIVQNALLLLYDEARAIEGEPIKDTASFAERLNLFMEKGL
jgi:molecular chaperone HtpG